MKESGKTFVLKKSYEISYALWRVAGNISEPNFAGKLFAKAIELIGYAVDEDYQNIELKLPSLETLVHFGVDINAIAPQNGEVIFQEIGYLRSAIVDLGIERLLNEAGKKIEPEGVDLSDVFSGPGNGKQQPRFQETEIEIESESNNFAEEPRVESAASSKQFKPAKWDSGKESGNHSGNGNRQSEQSDYVPEIRQPAMNRQSAILDKIRQIGNCRLSDIQEILPGLSERTIRYDIEALVQQNLIERVGSGGRGVYYKPKE